MAVKLMAVPGEGPNADGIVALTFYLIQQIAIRRRSMKYEVLCKQAGPWRNTSSSTKACRADYMQKKTGCPGSTSAQDVVNVQCSTHTPHAGDTVRIDGTPQHEDTPHFKNTLSPGHNPCKSGLAGSCNCAHADTISRHACNAERGFTSPV
jgi:hypothetical protein